MEVKTVLYCLGSVVGLPLLWCERDAVDLDLVGHAAGVVVRPAGG